VPEDDRALRARLDALEAEVKADADAARARKEAALAKVREQRAKDLAEREALRARQAELVTRRAAPRPPDRGGAATDDDGGEDDDDDGVLPRGGGDGIRNALALARGAEKVKGELAKPRKTGDKSWKLSGGLSLAFGPIGWLYAGSFREAMPAAAGWLLLAAIVSKLPLFSFLLLPVLLVVLPLSGIAGVLYALSYNRNGKRMKLFGKDEKPALPAGKRKQLPGK
jgi:hypothetical protein